MSRSRYLKQICLALSASLQIVEYSWHCYICIHCCIFLKGRWNENFENCFAQIFLPLCFRITLVCLFSILLFVRLFLIMLLCICLDDTNNASGSGLSQKSRKLSCRCWRQCSSWYLPTNCFNATRYGKKLLCLSYILVILFCILIMWTNIATGHSKQE